MFDFVTTDDQRTHATLGALVKNSNGQWKSWNQSQWYMRNAQTISDPTGFLATWGVDVEIGQRVVFTDAWIRWADYGHNSVRPIKWLWVLDEQGIVSQWKMAYEGTMREGTSINPQKTKNLWTRKEITNPLVSPVKVETEVSKSSHVGHVGRRLQLKGKVVMVKSFTRAKHHYYDSGVSYVTKIDSDGNSVVYFGEKALGEEGDLVEVQATVKEHTVDPKWGLQTVINRPRIMQTQSQNEHAV
jgi:hypothetical protein